MLNKNVFFVDRKFILYFVKKKMYEIYNVNFKLFM